MFSHVSFASLQTYSNYIRNNGMIGIGGNRHLVATIATNSWVVIGTPKMN